MISTALGSPDPFFVCCILPPGHQSFTSTAGFYPGFSGSGSTTCYALVPDRFELII